MSAGYATIFDGCFARNEFSAFDCKTIFPKRAFSIEGSDFDMVRVLDVASAVLVDCAASPG